MRVYHFLPSKWALEDLEKRRLKIATFDDLNDPFELSPFRTRSTNLQEILSQLKSIVAEHCGILCFSRRWKNPLMWSHYAERFRGLCLGFDFTKGLENPLRYVEDRIPLDEEKLIDALRQLTPSTSTDQFIRENSRDERGRLALQTSSDLIKTIILTKYSGWSYEEEIRFFTDLTDKDTTGFYFKPFGDDLSLREVVLGPLSVCSEETVKVLIRPYRDSVTISKACLGMDRYECVRDM